MKNPIPPTKWNKASLILISACIYIAGCCSIPRAATYEQLYSFTKEAQKIKRRFGGSVKIISIRDFRENERYDEDIAALKEEVERYILQHPDLEEAAKNNLRALKVSAGATKEEVKLLLGEPDRVVTGGRPAQRAWEIWIYQINKSSVFTIVFLPVFFGSEKYYLYFQDNILSRIERHYLEQTFSASDSGMGLQSSKE